MFAFTSEALLQVCLGDEASVVDVEVMERKSHIRFCESSSTVDSNREELTVVDLTIMVEIDALEDLIDFLLRHIQFIEGGSELAEFECARIVRVQRSERIAEFFKIKSTRVNLIDQELKSGNLKLFWLTEVLNAAEHHKLVGLQKL